MWKCSASAISAVPISSRNERHSIFTVGWLCTKRPTGAAATSMTIIATTTAATMMMRLFAMPTAVMTESSENTMSRIAIWMIALMNGR